jgi:Na+/alanine symporter
VINTANSAIAVIGSASSFVESTLAQIYKVKDQNGFRGGPAYYMKIAPGPPSAIAMAIPVIFPVPTRAAILIQNAWNGDCFLRSDQRVCKSAC